MTAPQRGRGRPVLFSAAAREQYLAARRQGDSQDKAAATAGVAARTVRHTRRAEGEFRLLDDAAAAAGRAARTPHGESRYTNLGCRCEPCTTDASAKRQARKKQQAARSAPTGRKAAPVVAITPPDQGSPKAFPLARAS